MLVKRAAIIALAIAITKTWLGSCGSIRAWAAPRAARLPGVLWSAPSVAIIRPLPRPNTLCNWAHALLTWHALPWRCIFAHLCAWCGLHLWPSSL